MKAHIEIFAQFNGFGSSQIFLRPFSNFTPSALPGSDFEPELRALRRVPISGPQGTPLHSIPSLRRAYSQTSRYNSRVVESLLSRSGNTAETYVSYGLTQKLFEACSAQADYRIPQAAQKGADIPKTASGEDVGTGEGWWYNGMFHPSSFGDLFSSICNICFLSEGER
jgi:hypothetical protein